MPLKRRFPRVGLLHVNYPAKPWTACVPSICMTRIRFRRRCLRRSLRSALKLSAASCEASGSRRESNGRGLQSGSGGQETNGRCRVGLKRKSGRWSCFPRHQNRRKLGGESSGGQEKFIRRIDYTLVDKTTRDRQIGIAHVTVVHTCTFITRSEGMQQVRCENRKRRHVALHKNKNGHTCVLHLLTRLGHTV